MTAPLRCHLLIGPPASGKTTLAGVLAELTGAVVLSTDAVRGEIFGDAAVQGPWRDIEALLHQRIREAVAAGMPVIVDATHARRPWRLAITQALALPAPVEWIGWWLYTPLSTCLQWNHSRKRLVPEPVIREMAAALADPVFGPSRAEGMASVVAVVPTQVRDLEPLLRDELARLDHRIRSARNRESRFALHGYSRLLDLERLLYLLRLLSAFPDLAAEDAATRAELEAIVSPLPEGSATAMPQPYGAIWPGWRPMASAAPNRCRRRSSHQLRRVNRVECMAATRPWGMHRCSSGCSPCCAICCSSPLIGPQAFPYRNT
ncbi:MAG: ATP-binding protein [Synechococcaceae bacterium WB8_1B_136]|nr:ATP-binding protein [Synechococcaceae bacterium WB8_1B_136]